MSTTPENKLQHSFSIFQINFNYTRMFRYESQLIYSPRGDTDKVFNQAKELIEKLKLELSVEKGVLLNNETIIIKEKI